jgi:hypothetical protein
MYKPGQSGFTGGGRRLPDNLRGINSLTPLEVTKLISKYARMGYGEVALILQEKKVTVLELAFCSIFMESIKKGDFARISFLLDRACGKVPVMIDDDENILERERLSQIPLNELIELAQKKFPTTPEAG